MRNGGKLSRIGDYVGFADKIPLGSLMNRSLTVRTGHCPVQKFLPEPADCILKNKIDPSFVITHTVNLDEVHEMYRLWNDKEDGVVKVAWKP